MDCHQHTYDFMNHIVEVLTNSNWRGPLMIKLGLLYLSNKLPYIENNQQISDYLYHL